MLRSYFTATSGAMTDNRNLTVISSNLANLNSTGFRRDQAMSTTFSDMVVSRRLYYDNGEIGGAEFTRLAQDSVTDFTPGSYEDTGKPLDFAIVGDGWFHGRTANGDYILTRDGETRVNPEGYLELKRNGMLLLDDNSEPIFVGTGDVDVDSSGRIYTEDGYVAKLGIAQVDTERLTKTPEGFFTAAQNDVTMMDNPIVKGKTLETSNVDMTVEMTRAIALQRSFQANTQVMKILDNITESVVTEIARV